MVSPRRALAGGRRDAARLGELALVPAVASLLQPSALRAATDAGSGGINVRFPFPWPVMDLWTFVDVPNGTALAAGPGLDGALPVALAALLAEGLLGAGLLGSLSAGRDGGGYRFWRAAGRYARPVLAYTVLAWVVGVGLFVPAAAGGVGPVLLVGLLVLLLAYLFYLAPFLAVEADRGIGWALGTSLALATDGGAYLGFTLRAVAVGAVASLPLSALALNLGSVGLLLATVGVAPVALVLTAAASRFAAAAVDERGLDGPGTGPA